MKARCDCAMCRAEGKYAAPTKAKLFAFAFHDWNTGRRWNGQQKAPSEDYLRGLLVGVYGRSIDMIQIDEVMQ